jgi:hypothetical protein
MAVHKIEVAASAVELTAAVGWSVIFFFSSLLSKFVVQDGLLVHDIHTNVGPWLHTRRS